MNELHPVRNDEPLDDPKQDLFDRAPFAERVADLISGRHDEKSIVIGIYGPWGDGKTTLLNFMTKALIERGVEVVEFNPWLLGDAATLLPAFFAAVGRELEFKKGMLAAAGTVLREAGDALQAISVALPFGGAEPGKAAKALGELLAPSNLIKRRKAFEDALRTADKRVVVLLDDLDRLDDAELREMMKLVRLAAPFDRVTYVVACDDRAVAQALGRLQGGDEAIGHDFLEKIVQMPLHLPPASFEALFELVANGIEQILGDHVVTISREQRQELSRRLTDGRDAPGTARGARLMGPVVREGGMRRLPRVLPAPCEAPLAGIRDHRTILGRLHRRRPRNVGRAGPGDGRSGPAPRHDAPERAGPGALT
jgi:predicted KAP-like P-loop ATPase